MSRYIAQQLDRIDYDQPSTTHYLHAFLVFKTLVEENAKVKSSEPGMSILNITSKVGHIKVCYDVLDEGVTYIEYDNKRYEFSLADNLRSNEAFAKYVRMLNFLLITIDETG